MAPLIVLVVAFLLFFLAGRIGLIWFHPWTHDLRAAMTCMLLLTASAHWGKRRPDLIAMVPRRFPQPGWIVSITGILETAAAVGLVLESTHRAAGLSLVALFIAMFPANVRAANQRLTIGGRPVLAVVPRAVIQIAFIGAALLCAL